MRTPANIGLEFNKSFAKLLCGNIIRKSPSWAKDILSEREYLQKNPFIHQLISYSAGYCETLGAKKSFGKRIVTTDKCIMCKKCVNSCPTGNIQIRNDKLVMKGGCVFCMRCFYMCPVNAIRAPFPFDFVRLKHGYNIDKILSDSSIKEESRSGSFYKRYNDYLNNPDPVKR